MMRTVFMVLMVTGCGDTAPVEAPVLLETVSQKITFDSVDRLGPHHSISTSQTIEMRERETVLESTQTIEGVGVPVVGPCIGDDHQEATF